MTEARVEQIARLMHATYCERYERRNPHLRADPWEALSGRRQDDYRAAARAVLKKLGH